MTLPSLLLTSLLALPRPAAATPTDTPTADTAADTATAGDAAPCGGLYVLGTAPAYDQQGVPPAAPLLIQLGENGCAAADEDVTVSLRTFQGDTVLSQTFSLAEIRDARQLLRVEVAPDMLPDAGYELVVAPAYGVESVIPFSTGSGELSAISSDPAWDQLDVYRDNCSGDITAAWSITPAPDPQGLSVVGVRAVDAGGQGEILGLSLVEYAEGAAPYGPVDLPAEVCLEGFQIDATGQERSAGVQCAEAEEGTCLEGDQAASCGGCASLPAPALLTLVWPALLSGALIAARRRLSCHPEGDRGNE